MAQTAASQSKSDRSIPSIGLCDHCALPIKTGALRATIHGMAQRFCCYGCMVAQRIMGAPEHGVGGGAYNWHMAKMSFGWLLGGPLMGLSFVEYVGGFEGASVAEQSLVVWIVFGLATGIFLILGIPYLLTGLMALLRGRITADVLIALGASAAYGFSTYNLFTADSIEVAREHLYFDSGSMIIVLVSLGRFIEAAARRMSGQNLRELSAVQMGEAVRILSDGNEERVAASELQPGDTIRLLPGATVPADGEVLSGVSAISEALLTGEDTPVAKQVGSKVLAGTVNGNGAMMVRVSAVGADCVNAQVVKLAKQALARRSATELIVDRVAAVFVPGVMVVAGVAFWLAYREALGGAGVGGTDELVPVVEGMKRAISVLVVACPCALGLATPVAVAIAIGRATEMGMHFRSGEAVEALGRVKRMYLDKTGTLTTGRFGVTEMVVGEESRALRVPDSPDEPALRSGPSSESASGKRNSGLQAEEPTGVSALRESRALRVPESPDEPALRSGPSSESASGKRDSGSLAEERTGVSALGEEGTGVSAHQEEERWAGTPTPPVLAAVAGLEQQSEHWLAGAVLEYAKAQGVAPAVASEVVVIPGQGVRGVVGGAGWWVGAPERAGERELAPELAEALATAKQRGDAVMLAGTEREGALALISCTDTLKPNAARAISGLQTLGIELVLITGDHENRARRTAEQLGIARYHAGVKPEGKLALVEADPRPELAAMTGDGVNDGPALMRAGVGISFTGATGLARIAAGLTLAGEDLRKLPAAVVLARRTRGIIRGNLMWAFGYNLTAVGFAVAGALSPVMAAIAMLGSSAFVVRNSWRLRRFGGG